MRCKSAVSSETLSGVSTVVSPTTGCASSVGGGVTSSGFGLLVVFGVALLDAIQQLQQHRPYLHLNLVED